MLRYENKGMVIGFKLPGTYGNNGYSVECHYRYIKEKDNYSLTMYLMRNDISCLYEIGTNIITGTRETIKSNISKIVENGCKNGYFDKFIENFEFEQECLASGIDAHERS